MKYLLPLLLLSFSVAAQSVSTNFSESSDNATVVNGTNNEPETNPSDPYLGKTAFRVLFHAVGCAGSDHKQTEICNAQVVQAGQSVSYHFKWGTTSRGVQICTPKGHGGATDDWNCGSLNFHGHFTFPIKNGQTREVKKLHYIIYDAFKKEYSRIDGQSVVTG